MVADLELHGHYRWDTLLYERLGYACQRVDMARASAFTGVEQGKAERAVVVEEGGQLGCSHRQATMTVIFEEKLAVADLRAEPAMSNEMENMVVAVA